MVKHVVRQVEIIGQHEEGSCDSSIPTDHQKKKEEKAYFPINNPGFNEERNHAENKIKKKIGNLTYQMNDLVNKMKCAIVKESA